MQAIALTDRFPPAEVAAKIAVSLGIGLLVGIEREWSNKDLGTRTFALTALLGAMAALFGSSMAAAALVGVFLIVIFANARSLLVDRSLEATTSAALLVIFVLGGLAGQGHLFTPVAAAILMTMLLAWKVELHRFVGGLQPEEIRSAVLLGLLGLVVYPILPNRFIDRWALINPRQAWITVVVIAGLGFVNYVLLKLYGTRGLYVSGFLGGFVNSTAAAAELARPRNGGRASSRQSNHPPDNRGSNGGSLNGGALNGEKSTSEKLNDGEFNGGQFNDKTFSDGVLATALLLTILAMFARNLLILALFAPSAVPSAAAPLLVMAAIALVFARREKRPLRTPSAGASPAAPFPETSPEAVDESFPEAAPEPAAESQPFARHNFAAARSAESGSAAAPGSAAGHLHLESPVSLWRVLSFAALFLLIQIVSTLGQRYLGRAGFYGISILGGLVSSASTSAAAANMVGHGTMQPALAAEGVVLASLASALINLPIIQRNAHNPALSRRLTLLTIILVVAGVTTLIAQAHLPAFLR